MVLENKLSVLKIVDYNTQKANILGMEKYSLL